MKWLRFLLFPFGILYWLITSIRNYLYNHVLYKSYQAPIPVIAVGNLSVGGTGKSPQTEYLIRLLSDKYKVAVLSRGYKRKTEGFVLADENTRVEDLGDEPFQFLSKFHHIQVAVDADRTNGIKQLLQSGNPPEVILLDDAYQHRKVKATAYILLTAYGDLYCDDYILPVGNLRESGSGADRAAIIIVTKCPKDISEATMQKIKNKLQPKPFQKVFFTTISYDEYVYNQTEKIRLADIPAEQIFAVSGIANPDLFYAHLAVSDRLTFPDHHRFSPKDIDRITEKSNGKIIITTEKDYMRLKGKLPQDKLYYLPIKTDFIKEKEIFDQAIISVCNAELNQIS